jgi:hypothetical protein
MDKKNDVKTQGSAPGNRRNLVFYSTFLSVSKTPMQFSRFICFLGAVLGPPLSRPQNRRFHTKTLIAGSHFQKPDQIVISGMFEGFRSAQNLAKYVIQGVLAENLVKYVIQGVLAENLVKYVIQGVLAENLAKYVIQGVLAENLAKYVIQGVLAENLAKYVIQGVLSYNSFSRLLPQKAIDQEGMRFRAAPTKSLISGRDAPQSCSRITDT